MDFNARQIDFDKLYFYWDSARCHMMPKELNYLKQKNIELIIAPPRFDQLIDELDSDDEIDDEIDEEIESYNESEEEIADQQFKYPLAPSKVLTFKRHDQSSTAIYQKSKRLPAQ